MFHSPLFIRISLLLSKGISKSRGYCLSVLIMTSFYSVAFPITTALAQQSAPASPLPPGPGEMFMRMLPLFVIVFLIFYMLVIRPQEKQQKKQLEMIAALKKGDIVVTSSGVIARILSVEEDSFSLDLGSGAKLRVEKSHVNRRYEKPSQNQKEAK